jgi:hypothetical protein
MQTHRRMGSWAKPTVCARHALPLLGRRHYCPALTCAEGSTEPPPPRRGRVRVGVHRGGAHVPYASRTPHSIGENTGGGKGALMSATAAQPRLRVAFSGAFAVCLEGRVRAHLSLACDLVLADEVEIVPRLPEVDVLVTMAFTPEMGAAGRRLLMTPHVSGWTEGMLEARARLIAENILRAARGVPPVNLIPAAAGQAGP